MSDKPVYGQFCPLAMAAEFLCKRWMVLVLRELLLGSVTFNDIGRGVARMSRTLLSQRLKELEQRGLVKKIVKSNQRDTLYELTVSGRSLSSVVFGMAEWSQEWLHIEPSVEKVDTDHLLWSIRRSARPLVSLPETFIVHIFFPEQEPSHQNGWLIIEAKSVELCIADHGFDVDVQIEASAETLTKVYMGWIGFADAVASEELILHGPKLYTELAEEWFGRSRLAEIKKQPRELRVS
ncbi:MAG: helix-turn-helix transcriptional regulator [Kangiellaceae bacterium]|nr:helix-turn-helix transcriptional regulator [Kangiellaceae bacterium]